MYISPPKKPMTLPGASTRPSPRRRRPEYDHDRLKLRRSILEYPDRHSGLSGKTMAEEVASLFNLSSTSGEIRPTGPNAQKAQSGANKVLRRNPRRQHNHRDMFSPGIPAISMEEIEEMNALIRPRSKKRGAAEALEEPSTPSSSQSAKRQRTNSSATPTTSTPASSLSGSSWPPPMSPSPKKLEAVAYQRSIKRRRELKRASVDGTTEGVGVVEWMDGLPRSRFRTSPNSLRREIHNMTIKIRKMKVDGFGA